MSLVRRLGRAARGRLEGVFSRRPLSRLITWRAPRSERRVALTFDDGPVDGYTDEVLAILAGAGVRASFFLLGERVAARPAVVGRIAAAGHAIGVHGWDHRKQDLPRQTERTAAALAELGVTTRLFRPPGGYLEPRTQLWLARRGWTTVMWSFDTIDSMRHEGKRQGPIDYRRVAGGDIVLMHDDNPVCTGELPGLLATLGAAGLEPATLDELLGG